jgi:hypothetical protein
MIDGKGPRKLHHTSDLLQAGARANHLDDRGNVSLSRRRLTRRVSAIF